MKNILKITSFAFFNRKSTSWRVFEGFSSKTPSFEVAQPVNRDLIQKDGCKTQDDRMTKKFCATGCIPGLARHFFDIREI